MSKRLKNKIYLSIAIIIGVIAIIIIFVIYPSTKTILTINRDITTQRNDLEKKNAQGIDLTQTKADLDRVKEALNKSDILFIKKDHELEFITELEGVAATNNVSINLNSDFVGQKISTSVRQVPLQINVIGSYPSLVAFLNQLESLPYYFNANIIMVSPKIDGDKINIIMQLTGQTYVKD